MDYNTTSFESFYGGGASSLSPEYGNFTGYRMSASQLGFPGSPQTANQLGEAINAAKQGVKAFEVQMLQPDAAETIPKQHFKEMRALMKLSGVKPSVHGPMIDAAGFDDKGNWGQEFGRASNERRMFDTLEKAYALGPEGNIPVVFHSSAGTPGAEFRPGGKEEGRGDVIMEKGAMINRETGQASQVKDRRSYFLSTSEKDFKLGKDDLEKGGTLMTVERSVDNSNAVDWDEKLKGVIIGKGKVDRALGQLWQNAEALNLSNIDINNGDERKVFNQAIKNNPTVQNEMVKAEVLLENNNLTFRSLFNTAYKYGTDEQRKLLKELSSDWKKDSEEKSSNPFREQMDASELQDTYFNKFKDITSRKLIEKGGLLVSDERFGAPKIYQEANEFAMDKAATTFGNLAMKSYDKLGADKSPMLAIEPFHPGAGLSSTDDMVQLVKASRKNFAKQLVEEKGFSKGEAKDVAAKKIGVTWDVGHINMIKKYGFTDKDIVKQTKKIAPMVKHVHLTDNFGFADTHLAPGMGNVPMKKILEQLEKTGRFGEMRKIVEAGAFVQHFKKSPHGLTMAAFGSPLYAMSGDSMGWNRAMDVQGAYFGGYGTTSPSTHHQYFGAGFTTMPVELGGQQPGGNSRFGGTPMA